MSEILPLNVPVRVLGWEDGGGARVELLVASGGMGIGETRTAHVKAATLGKATKDFEFLRKQGLRTGGLVILRKYVVDDGAILAREAEPLLQRERDGLTVLLPGAAACILEPPAGSAIVRECLIALCGDRASGPMDAPTLGSIRNAVVQACQYGFGGIIATGEDRDGDPVEVVYGGDRKRSADELIEEFLLARPPETLAEARKAKKPWSVVPYFRAEVDPDRDSRISAQRANLDYGSPDEPMWNPTNAVMRLFADTWLVCDVNPPVDITPPTTSLLLDLM